MKNRAGLVFIATLVLPGCSQKLQKLPQLEGTQRLIGSYSLHVGHDCQDKGIETASLALHSNGTYSQEGKFKGGNSFHIDGKKWSYDGGGNVFFFDLKIYDPEHISPEAKLTNASLIVDFHKPTVIILDPDLDCFFERNEKTD
jgi:hypothetical protein